MKLKYYLRGLGVGIFVTAAVLSLSAGNKQTSMTDAQIKEKAKALGMVEGVLKELEETETAKETEITKETETAKGTEITKETAPTRESEAALESETKADDAGKNTETPKADTSKTDTSKAETPKADTSKSDNKNIEENKNEGKQESKPAESKPSENKPAESKPEQSKPEQSKEQVSTVIVAIYPGEGSYTVSKKLASLGLVESADIYDKFLCQNGYDKKLATGNYEITAGSTAEEIAKILTGKR